MAGSAVAPSNTRPVTPSAAREAALCALRTVAVTTEKRSRNIRTKVADE